MKNPLSRTLLLLLLLSVAFTNAAEGQWRKISDYSSTFFNEVFFVDNNNGWFTQFNNTIVRTTDGGTNWSTSNLPNGGNSSNRDLCFLSSTVGFVSGEDGIWKTSDGGANWTNITPSSLATGRSSSCWFISASVGVYGIGSCGDSTVTFYYTSDGGTNWGSVSYLNSSVDAAVGGITYASGTFWASGGSGKCWYSTDNGANWTYAPSNSGGWQEDMISFGSTLYIASANGGSCNSTGGGKVLRSTNGGSSWSSTSFNATTWGVTMYSSSNGWCCGDNGHAWRTIDGGSTWVESSCGLDSNGRLDDIFFSDATHGWAVGDGIYKYIGDSFARRQDSIDFGDILVGSSSADSSAWIKALGSGGTVSARSILGADATQFGASSSLGTISISSCQSLASLLHFSPTSIGPKRAYFEISTTTNSGVNKRDTIVLKGRGVKPQIASSQLLKFDTLACGADMLDTLVVMNTGNYPLTISGASVQNQSGGTFQIVSYPPTIPAAGPASGQGTVILKVTPSKPGPVLGTLVLTNNDTDPNKSPWNIQLVAFKRTVAVAFNQDTLLTLGSVRLNAQAGGCITYRNTGDGDQRVESVLPVSGDPNITLALPVSNASVPVNSLLSFCFSATASDTGWHQRRFKVRTQPCDRDTFITVRFYARSPIITSPQSASMSVSCEGALVDTLMIANTGNDTLILQQPTLSGANSGDYTIISPATWPDTILAGKTGTVVVRFAPDASLGNRTATLAFPNNDLFPQKTPWPITLNGRRESGGLLLSRHNVDLGDRCLSEFPMSIRIDLTNNGSIASRITSVEPLLSSPAVSITRNPAGSTIMATGNDSAIFTAAPIAPGPFLARYVVTYEPCTLRDTITISGNVTSVSLSASPAVIDFGSQPLGFAAIRKVVLTNNGNAPATVKSLLAVPPLAGLTIVDPTGPFVLAPGASDTVTVSATLADTGSHTTTLVAISDVSCPDTLRTKIQAEGIRAAAFATRTSIDYGTIVPCDGSSRRDTLSIMNLGTAPVEIRSIVLASGLATTFALSNASLPHTLLPGERLPVNVDALGTTGVNNDTIVVTTDDPQRPTIRIPVTSQVLVPGLTVLNTTGQPADTVRFATLFECQKSDVQELVLHNAGILPDTITLGLQSPDFTLLGPGIMILEPGRDSTIRVQATLNQPAATSATLRILSNPCAISRLLTLRAEFQQVASTADDLDFGEVFVDQNPSGEVELHNTGEAVRTIERVYIDDPSGQFALKGLYDGKVLPAGETLPLDVSYKPGGPGSSTARAVIIFSSPCPDTLFASIRAVATDDRYVVSASASPVRGRWGTNVLVPIRFENRLRASVHSVRLEVKTSPRLLDPLEQIIHAANVGVERIGYDPATGSLLMQITAADAGSLATADTMIGIPYRVLRGDSISSPIDLKLSELPSNVQGETSPGEFALEDYCDAYGRLLRVRGSVELKQNAPNPFNPETVIEFETAFTSHVTLAVYDGLGREVARIVDETLPAGRRRLTFDGRSLASGVYTYRLTTGLQVLTRQMTVTK